MEEKPAPPREPDHKPSFWSTMPGILSGLAALLTAVATLLAAASAAGLLAPAPPTPIGQALVGGEAVASPALASPQSLVEAETLATASSESPPPSVEAGSLPTPTLSPPPAAAATVLAVEAPSLSTPTALGAPPALLAATTAVESLEIEFVTGDLPEAETEDELILTLGRRDWKLKEARLLAQTSASTHRYSLSVPRALVVGDLQGIEVCKDKGKKDPWYLSEVILYVNDQPFERWEVNQWLDDKTELCWQDD